MPASKELQVECVNAMPSIRATRLGGAHTKRIHAQFHFLCLATRHFAFITEEAASSYFPPDYRQAKFHARHARRVVTI